MRFPSGDHTPFRSSPAPSVNGIQSPSDAYRAMNNCLCVGPRVVWKTTQRPSGENRGAAMPYLLSLSTIRFAPDAMVSSPITLGDPAGYRIRALSGDQSHVPWQSVQTRVPSPPDDGMTTIDWS